MRHTVTRPVRAPPPKTAARHAVLLRTMSSLMKDPPRPMMTPHETCGKRSLSVRVPSETGAASPDEAAIFCARSSRAFCSVSEMRCCAQSRLGSAPEMVMMRSRVTGSTSSMAEMWTRAPDSLRICRSSSPPLPMTFPVSFSSTSIFRCWISRPALPASPPSAVSRTRLL